MTGRIFLALLMVLMVCGQSFGATLVSKTVAPADADFTTLSDAIAWFVTNYPDFTASDIEGEIHISGEWASAETTAITTSGLTLDATRTLKIYGNWTPPASGAFWDTTKYRIKASNWAGTGLTLTAHTYAYNIQARNSSGSASSDSFKVPADAYAINCLAWDSNDEGFDGAGVVINCVAYDCGTGFNGGDAFNCTSIGNTVGFARHSGVATFYNCLATGNTTADFSISEYSWDFAVFNCASGDDTADDDTDGSDNRINQTFSFTDYDNNNFHLASDDAGAKDYGTDVSATTGISVDFEDEARDASWDIGADEYVSAAPAFISQVVIIQ